MTAANIRPSLADSVSWGEPEKDAAPRAQAPEHGEALCGGGGALPPGRYRIEPHTQGNPRTAASLVGHPVQLTAATMS